MFLADTNVVSELRRAAKADAGVTRFFLHGERGIFLPVQTIGELRQGIENLRHRGDHPQAQRLEKWFESMLAKFASRILDFVTESAQMWGILMGPNNQNPVDRQIAAIALVYDLTVVTRNADDFAGTGVRLLNPLFADSHPAKPAN
jgi:predicted nucleic acid-binding protein